jgi:hypothetical protein
MAHGYCLSSNQNHSGIGFGRCVTENITSACDVVHSGENIGISNSQYGMDTVKTAQPGVSGCVGDCGIFHLLPADCARMMATAVVYQGIFEDPFSESQAHTVVIDHVIWLSDFHADSAMVKYDDQQQCLTLSRVILVGLDEVDKFFTVKDNGTTFDSTPMLFHLRRFKASLGALQEQDLLA